MRVKSVILGGLLGMAVMGYVVWNRYPFFRGLFLDVSPTAVDKLNRGMTLEEVGEIIGGPPGDYRLDPVPFYQPGGMGYTSGGVLYWTDEEYWRTDFGEFQIRFSHDVDNGNHPRVSSIWYKPSQPNLMPLLLDFSKSLAVAGMVLVGCYVIRGRQTGNTNCVE